MRREMVVQEALRYLDYPSYRYRGPEMGCGEDGFDCSGYITFLLRKVGFPNPLGCRHCNEYFDRFGVFVHYQCRARGDLVFFSRYGRMPTHMGIMISRNQYIHAPGKNGTHIQINRLQQKPIRLAGAPVRGIDAIGREPQIYCTNPIGFKRLAIRSGRFSKIVQ